MLNRPRVHQNIVTQEGMTRTHICSISNKFNNLNMKKCGIFLMTQLSTMQAKAKI